MRKIMYPNGNKRLDLESDYWKMFEDCELQVEWERLRTKLIDWSDSIEKDSIYPSEIKDVVCGRYENLVDIYLDYKAIKSKKKGDLDFDTFEKQLYSLFSYSQSEDIYSKVFQPLISKFFMQHADDMKLHVCHYCEMSYVNVYGFSDVFNNFGHFLKNATKEEIRHYIRKEDGNILSDKSIKSILDLQMAYSEDHITEAFDNLKLWRGTKKSEKVSAKLRNHFDLDHFLPKSKCPIVGLSPGQTHEILKKHHDINRAAQVVNRCFRVGLKKSTI